MEADKLMAKGDKTVDGDHGRIEERRAEVLHDVAWLAKSYDWPGQAQPPSHAASRLSTR